MALYELHRTNLLGFGFQPVYCFPSIEPLEILRCGECRYGPDCAGIVVRPRAQAQRVTDEPIAGLPPSFLLEWMEPVHSRADGVHCKEPSPFPSLVHVSIS